LLELSVLIEHFTVATAALSAGRRKGGVMAEPKGKLNKRDCNNRKCANGAD
jgi:hypothetical protein